MAWTDVVQAGCAVVGVAGLWFAGASLGETKKQVTEAVRQNHLGVQPFIVPNLVKNNNQFFVNLKNYFDKPASNIHLVVRDNSMKENKFFIGKTSIEFLLKDHNKGEGSIEFDINGGLDKSDLIEQLTKIYGKDNIKDIKQKIQDNKSSIYVFYIDLNKKLRVAIRDFDTKNGEVIYLYRNQHIQ